MARARLLLISLLALVVAVGLAFIARGFAAPKTVAVGPRAAPPHATIQVLIAAHSLAIGDRLDPTSIAWRAWPVDGLDPAYVTAGTKQIATASASAKLAAAAGDAASATKAAVTGDAGPAGALMGEVVREAIFAGEPIVARKLVQAGTSGVMAVTLAPGMRAMSIPVTTESAAGGFIQPGDHVDVVLTRKLDAPMGGAPAGVETLAAMRNVRVMAIDQTLKASDKVAATASAATATLEVTPDQAQALVLAHAQGELTLVLRSYADGVGPPTRGYQQATAALVHVYRNGAATDVRVTR